MENNLKELELIDVLKVVKRRKKIIVSVFLITLALSAVWYFLAPPVFEGSILIEVGRDGLGKLLESPKEVIEEARHSSGIDFSGTNPSDTSLVSVTVSGENREEVEEELKKIEESILESHSQIIEKEKEDIEKQKAAIEEETERLEKDIASFLVRGQQVAELQLKIYSNRSNLNSLETIESLIEETRMIKGIKISKSGPSYFLVIFGASLGLFLGVVLAFLKDWWKRNKEAI